MEVFENCVARRGGASDGAPKDPATDADTDSSNADAAVVRAVIEAQRRRLVTLRADGAIGDAAFQRVEEELDWAELDWTRLVQAG